MGYSTNNKILLIDSRRLGADVRCFCTPREMVLDLLDSGLLGDGAHGSDEHISALHEVARQAGKLAAQLERNRTLEDDVCDDCDGSGKYLIDGIPQACICSEPQE